MTSLMIGANINIIINITGYSLNHEPCNDAVIDHRGSCDLSHHWLLLLPLAMAGMLMKIYSVTIHVATATTSIGNTFTVVKR